MALAVTRAHLHEPLRRMVEPWLALLLAKSPGCQRGKSAVLVVFTVDVTNVFAGTATATSTAIVDAAGQARIRMLREAIDLAYLLLATDPEVLWAHTGAKTLRFSKTQIRRGDAFHLVITVEAKNVADTRGLVQHLGESFLATLDPQDSTNARYSRVRNALLKGLADRLWWSKAVKNPVHIRYVIGTAHRMNHEPHAVEAYFARLGQFVMAAAKRRTATRHQIPVDVTSVELELEQVILTHRIVNKIKGLMSIRKGFVSCEHVRVEPMMYQCSHETLVAFLEAVATSRKRLSVYTGPFQVVAHDRRDHMNRTGLCSTILQAIASCERVDLVDMTGMLELFLSPTSRRQIFRAMIEHVISRPTPCDLVFQDVRFDAVDVQALQEEHTKWRSEHTAGRLRVKNVTLSVIDNENAFTNAMIEALDDVKGLSIGHPQAERAVFSSTTLTKLLNKFGTLRKLELAHVNIASMDVLLEACGEKLEELLLCEFQLVDRSSFLRFVGALGDYQTPLAHNLRRFELKRTSEESGVFELSVPEIEALDGALLFNTVLEIVAVWLRVQRADVPRMLMRLTRTDGRLVRSKLTERTSVYERKKLAFMSILQSRHVPLSARHRLDSNIVAQILALAAPTVGRQVVAYLKTTM